ncbi:MAG: VWA domain-containing protein, partial [Gemmataceae bacterium]
MPLALTRLLDRSGLAVVALLAGVALAAGLWFLRAKERRSFTGLVIGVGLVLLAAGGFLLPEELAVWLAIGSGGVLFVAVLVLLISGSWTRYLGIALGTGVALGLGGLVTAAASRELMHGIRVLTTAEMGIAQLETIPFFATAVLLHLFFIGNLVTRMVRRIHPEAESATAGLRSPVRRAVPAPWRAGVFAGLYILALAGLIIGYVFALLRKGNWWNEHLGWLSAAFLVVSLSIAICWLSFRSLAALGPARRVVAIALRCLLVALLVFSLAEFRLRKSSESLTVMYLVDRSLSIPEEFDDNEKNPTDLRWKRIQDFIKNAVGKRGSGHELDQSGVIVFGRRPRLALPPSTADKLFLTDELAGNVDKYYTDIGAAVKLALASFPESTSKRIILLSDGNENLGNVEEQARLAKLNGVQIDVVMLAAGQRNESEVMVQAVEAPPLTEQGSRLPIRVLLRSYNPRLVRGTLQLRQKATEQVVKDGKSEVVVTTTLVPVTPGPGVEQSGLTSIVILRPGLNSFSFRQTLTGTKQSYTYEAVFTPTHVAGDNDEWVKGVPGDRPQNNTASTHVVALGQRRVLVVEQEGKAGQHALLIAQLQRAGKSKFQIASATTADLPKNKAELGVFLSMFDCVILANVPAEQLTDDQMEMLRSNTYDQGCGLVMIGGPDSFGAGGWQETPVEKALPVDCDIKSLKVAGKGGLVMIMHASEMDQGNALQKQIAKLAIDKLAPVDMVGMIYYDFN